MQGVLKGGNLKQVEIVLNGITHTLLFACITPEFRRVSCHLVKLLEKIMNMLNKSLVPGSTDPSPYKILLKVNMGLLALRCATVEFVTTATVAQIPFADLAGSPSYIE